MAGETIKSRECSSVSVERRDKRENDLEKMSDRVQEDEAGQAGRSDHLHSCSIGSCGRDIVDPAFILPDGRKVRNRVEVMKMNENKQEILDLLLPALQKTRNLYDLAALEYDPVKELVYAKFASGFQKIANVAMDSGTSMIRDVIKQIV